MRYLLFLLLLISSVTYSQSNVDFRGDSARFYKNGGSMEVVIRNSTKDRTNGVLVNTGNGVTSFLKYLQIDSITAFRGRFDHQLVLPDDTLSYAPSSIFRTTTRLLAFAPNGNLYKLWNGVWSLVGAGDSANVQILGDSAIVVNDDTLIIRPIQFETDLAPEYAFQDGDTIRLYPRQYIQDSVLITKSGDTLFFPNGDTIILGNASMSQRGFIDTIFQSLKGAKNFTDGLYLGPSPDSLPQFGFQPLPTTDTLPQILLFTGRSSISGANEFTRIALRNRTGVSAFSFRGGYHYGMYTASSGAFGTLGGTETPNGSDVVNMTFSPIGTRVKKTTLGGTDSATLIIEGDKAIRIPVGSTAARPAVVDSGYFRYNTDSARFEGRRGTTWQGLAWTGEGGGSGTVSTGYAIDGDGSGGDPIRLDSSALSDASTTVRGLVNTVSQTFSGEKNFYDKVILGQPNSSSNRGQLELLTVTTGGFVAYPFRIKDRGQSSANEQGLFFDVFKDQSSSYGVSYISGNQEDQRPIIKISGAGVTVRQNRRTDGTQPDSVEFKVDGTGGIGIPSGTTALRTFYQNRQIRYNTDSSRYEVWIGPNNSDYRSLAYLTDITGGGSGTITTGFGLLGDGSGGDPARLDSSGIKPLIARVSRDSLRINTDDVVKVFQALGSEMKAQTVGMNVTNATGSLTLPDGRAYFTCVWLSEAKTITGVGWLQQTAGAYTADATNQIGLYTYSGGTLTLVASSANDGDLWKGSSNSVQKKAFSSTYNAEPGLYIIGMVYNSSAETTAPVIRRITNAAPHPSFYNFDSSGKLAGLLDSQTALPSPQSLASTTTNSNMPYVFIY